LSFLHAFNSAIITTIKETNIPTFVKSIYATYWSAIW
jgi:hypothetical protein